jgi:hypothetical protein
LIVIDDGSCEQAVSKIVIAKINRNERFIHFSFWDFGSWDLGFFCYGFAAFAIAYIVGALTRVALPCVFNDAA